VSGGGNQNYNAPGSKHRSVPYLVMMTDHSSATIPAEQRVVGGILSIGRKIDDAVDPARLGFYSTVISRKHAEIWVHGGELYLRDAASGSGTFLNNNRLSEAGKESKPQKLRSGDLLRFGTDVGDGKIRNVLCVTHCLCVEKAIVCRLIVRDKIVEVANGADGHSFALAINCE
jgi:hypothetical protein